GEDEHYFVLGPALPAEDVLQHAERSYVGHDLADLFEELPVDGVHRVLPELHVAPQRPLKQRFRRFGHQQSPVARPPDDRHRLDDLPLRVHRPVVSRRADEFAARPPLHKKRKETEAAMTGNALTTCLWF